MNMILIKRDSKEWNLMWEWLAQHPINDGLSEPSIAMNEVNGECWQYMGSYRGKGNSAVHTFRHRSHPLDNERKNLSMNSTDALCNDDIEKQIPIK